MKARIYIDDRGTLVVQCVPETEQEAALLGAYLGCGSIAASPLWDDDDPLKLKGIEFYPRAVACE